MERMLIKNIGVIISGRYEEPILEAEAIYIESGRIKKIGNLSEMPDISGATIIDANGLYVCPGLIDAHTHPLIGDYIPSIKAVDWIDSYVNGGITSLVSAGEMRLPGFSPTVAGVKSLAVLSNLSWEEFHPGGAKVKAGAVMLAQGLTAKDFEELAGENINIVGEVGMEGLTDPGERLELVKTARSHGFKVLAHSGGASFPGCASITADDLFQIKPDVVCHLNGAPTPMCSHDIRRVVLENDCYYDLIAHGNMKMTLQIINLAAEAGKLDRVLVGTNAPSMAGFSPVGLWMLMGTICALTGVKPEQAIAMATGNVASCYGLNQGLIEEGYSADILLCDVDLGSSSNCMLEWIASGSIPSVALVIIDGRIVLTRCRNTAPPKRNPVVEVH